MYIQNIVNYDEDAQEASIIVTDGVAKILCYAQPFTNRASQFVLSAFMCKDIMSCNNGEYSIKKIDQGAFAYKLQGKLIDVEKGIVQIGDLFIEDVKFIPKDISNGTFIEFTTMRIDFIEN